MQNSIEITEHLTELYETEKTTDASLLIWFINYWEEKLIIAIEKENEKW